MSNCDFVQRNVTDSEKFKWIRYMKLLLTLAGLYYKPLRWSSIPNFAFPVLMLSLTAAICCYQIFVHKTDDVFNLTVLKLASNIYVCHILAIQMIFMFRITPRIRQFLEKYKDFKLKYDSQNNSVSKKLRSI